MADETYNTTKCVVLKCSRSPTPIQHDYRLNDHVLYTDIKDKHPYLGVTLQINHYLGPATYQKFLKKPHRH